MNLKVGKHVYPVKGLITSLGATLLLISMAIDFSYANLNTYVISYIRNEDNSTTYKDWVYVTSTKVFVQGITMPFLGKLELMIGTKQSILLGCIIYSGGIALTSFTIKYGLIPVILSMAVTHGFAFGLIYAQAIGCVIKWFLKENKGFMASIAVAGYGFGAMIWIPLETAFVNPKNIDPIAIDPNATNSDKYFQDEDVLNNVPNLFLLLGGIFAGLEIIGLLLLQVRSESELEQCENYQKTYGQSFISDDFFFVYVGLTANILNGSSRLLWGLIYDFKGFRFNAFLIVGVLTLLSWICLLHYAIPKDEEMIHKVFFGVWLSLFFAFFPGIYATMAPVTEATFGHLNYARDYGLLFTQSMVGSLVLTLVSQLLYDKIHYYGMFTICGGFGIVAEEIIQTVRAGAEGHQQVNDLIGLDWSGRTHK